MRLVLISFFIFLALFSYAHAEVASNSWHFAAGQQFLYEKLNSAETAERKPMQLQMGRELEDWNTFLELSQFQLKSAEGIYAVKEIDTDVILWSQYKISFLSWAQPFIGVGLGVRNVTVEQKISRLSDVSDSSRVLLSLSAGAKLQWVKSFFLSLDARAYKAEYQEIQPGFSISLGCNI